MVHYRAPSGRRLHSNLRGFTQAHPVGVGLIQVTSGFTQARLAVSDSFGIAWVHSSTSWGRLDHSGSPGVTWAFLWVAGFIRVRVDSLGKA